MDLTIHLIRANDVIDEIVFRRRMNGTFLLRFVNGSCPNTVWVNQKTIEEVIQYIESTFFFFRVDAIPFERISISIPSRPRIFARHSEFTSLFGDDVLDSIETYLYNPPTSFTQ